MGFVGNLLGIGGGGHSGHNWKAQSVPVIQGVNEGQLGTAYNQAQYGLGQNQNFLNALRSQNGIQNQSNVFNQQQALANQFQQQALGQGPNPALAQLAQSTGQNVANQAALMAGQRGSGANAGLLARQIGQQGANIQQNAVGQSAVMQAQQQLAAQQALQQQQQNMAALAGQQIGQYGGALNATNQATQNEQQMLQNALAQYNATRVNQQNAMNAANASIQGQTAQGQSGLLGGVLGGIGAGLGLFSKGGKVQHYDEGGEVQPSSFLGKFQKGFTKSMAGQNFQSMGSAGAGAPQNPLYSGMSSISQGLGHTLKNIFSSKPNPDEGLNIKPGFSPGEQQAHGGPIVPGKAKAKGDNLKNDTVPAMLSPGEIVLPRSVANHDEAPQKAKEFVARILAKKHGAES